jgi:acetolactate synthase regulatory subunit
MFLLERFFGGWHAFHARINCDCNSQRARDPLENRLSNVVPIATVEQLDVQVAAQVAGQSATELLG